MTPLITLNCCITCMPAKYLYIDAMSTNKWAAGVCLCVCLISSSGQYLLTGSSNGVVRVHILPPSLTIPTSLGSYWALSMHDPHTGPVSYLASTYDDHYVVSAGADGNVFVYSANLPTATPERPSLPEELEVCTDLQPLHNMLLPLSLFLRLYLSPNQQRTLMTLTITGMYV